MREFISHLTERNFQKRTVALIENGSWAPSAVKGMAAMLEPLQDIKIIDEKVSIKIAVNDETVRQLEFLAEKLSDSLK